MALLEEEGMDLGFLHQVGYFVLILLKISQWLMDKHSALDLSIRRLGFYLRNHILVENITVTLKNMRIQFNLNIPGTYLEQLSPQKVQEFSYFIRLVTIFLLSTQ